MPELAYAETRLVKGVAPRARVGFFRVAIPYMLQNLAWLLLARWLLQILFHLRIDGAEHIREAKRMAKARNVGVIFAMNHLSEWDPIVALLGIRPFSSVFPMFYVAAPLKNFDNREVFGWRARIYGKRFFEAWGAYPILEGQKDYAKSLAFHADLLRAGHTVLIFPEGGRSKDGGFRETHGGVGYLAEATGAIVLPVRIEGVWRTSHREFILGKRHVRLSYGAPLTGEDIVKNRSQFPGETHYRQAAAFITKKIVGLLP